MTGTVNIAMRVDQDFVKAKKTKKMRKLRLEMENSVRAMGVQASVLFSFWAMGNSGLDLVGGMSTKVFDGI